MTARDDMDARNRIENLGDRIRKQRLKIGYTQENLAEAVGDSCTARQICGWERGNHEPVASHLFLISKALRMTPNQLAPIGMFDQHDGNELLLLFDRIEIPEQKMAFLNLLKVMNK